MLFDLDLKAYFVKYYMKYIVILLKYKAFTDK